jgi:hypothetical protein
MMVQVSAQRLEQGGMPTRGVWSDGYGERSWMTLDRETMIRRVCAEERYLARIASVVQE